MPEPAGTQAPADLVAALAQVPDPRSRRGIRHRLVTVLALAVCAVLAGARSYVAIAEWAHALPLGVRIRLGLTVRRAQHGAREGRDRTADLDVHQPVGVLPTPGDLVVQRRRPEPADQVDVVAVDADRDYPAHHRGLVPRVRAVAHSPLVQTGTSLSPSEGGCRRA